MLVKWIQCAVLPGAESEFSVAQRAWSRLETAAGFVGQVGGWNARRDGEACIVGIWSDRIAYERFMESVHDAVVEANDQGATYASSRVALADVVIDMAGDVPIASARLLRVADCTVIPERVAHFVEAQRDVWSPGMRAAGMLGGWFARVPGTERFLVLSLWPSAAVHDDYVAGPFAALRERAGASADLATIDGARIALEPEWTVARRAV